MPEKRILLLFLIALLLFTEQPLSSMNHTSLCYPFSCFFKRTNSSLCEKINADTSLCLFDTNYRYTSNKWSIDNEQNEYQEELDRAAQEEKDLILMEQLDLLFDGQEIPSEKLELIMPPGKKLALNEQQEKNLSNMEQILLHIKKAALKKLSLECLTQLLFLVSYSLHTKQAAGSCLSIWFKAHGFEEPFNFYAYALMLYNKKLNQLSFIDQCSWLLGLELNIYYFLAENFIAAACSPEEFTSRNAFIKQLTHNYVKTNNFSIVTQTPIKNLNRICILNKHLLQETIWLIPLITTKEYPSIRTQYALNLIATTVFERPHSNGKVLIEILEHINETFSNWVDFAAVNDFQNLYELLQEQAHFIIEL